MREGGITGYSIPAGLPDDVHERVLLLLQRRDRLIRAEPMAAEAVALTNALNKLLDPHRLLDTQRHRRARERMAERRAIGVAPEGKHGLNGYSNFGCRCSICRAAKADEHTQRKAREEQEDAYYERKRRERVTSAA